MTDAALWHPSPNSGERRGGARPDLIVLHYTAMGSAEVALARLCDPDAGVSAHYLIGRCGTCWQMVDEAARAWHAGSGAWGEVCDVNSRSIGIELDNDGHSPFSAPMMDALVPLLRGIMARWSIPPLRVIGHSDMAPGRKFDPGPRFDWRRLAREGVSVWPEDTADPDGEDPGPEARLADRVDGLLREFGYASGTAQERLGAFRDRFRPGARGAASMADVQIAMRLKLIAGA
ncbi:N-acetylmuramoyl-L-alanine amidase [Meridianimarinicoccus roseus]|uniref:N-acetylmuramoyl-L-alanine amidase n=1 Tax=Meridianimarinicoccus roseus TaxID=2072018 RepID=A0A2V2LIQ8_9RHOB|nr:N-acetylmuramoyl-L-alanine amidase [Meridianimarinicoccus roseus]PWR02309.1 N-acetylmuramoyl-L-alanine amidase [Meridianimarinicoccus roseus]